MTCLPKRLERHEQADGVALLRLLGAKVYISGTVRRSGDYQGTMQTPGIPDVEAFLPYPEGKMTTLRLLKWEVKRDGGRLSVAQQEYRRWIDKTDVDYVVGSFQALKDWLIACGYLSEDGTRIVRRS
jgi:hypothetical protein